MSDYNEPWRVNTWGPIANPDGPDPQYADFVDGKNQTLICCYTAEDGATWYCDPKVAARIVACVNACAGMTDEGLEEMSLGQLTIEHACAVIDDRDPPPK